MSNAAAAPLIPILANPNAFRNVSNPIAVNSAGDACPIEMRGGLVNKRG